MLEWRIVEEFESPPGEPPQHTSPRRRWWLPWLAAFLLIGLAVWALLQWQQARLHTDLTQVVLMEERALRAGAIEEAARFADPAAPADWQTGYRASFRQVGSALPTPQVTVLVVEGPLALVHLTYESDSFFWQTLRAYRLVGGRWRRTPIEEKDEPRAMERGSHSWVWTLPEEEDFIREHPEWWTSPGWLREQLLSSWEGSCDYCTLNLTLQRREFSPPITLASSGLRYLSLQVRSPLLFEPDWDSPLPPASQYRLAVATAVVRALTAPDGLPVGWQGQSGLSQDGVALLTMLQQAEARQLVLEESERRALRNAWRQELGEVWPAELAGPLPLSSNAGEPEARQRWFVVNLLLERQIALGGVGTPARLANSALSYPASDFGWERFFQALIGGSLNDLLSLSHDYILMMEP